MTEDLIHSLLCRLVISCLRFPMRMMNKYEIRLKLNFTFKGSYIVLENSSLLPR